MNRKYVFYNKIEYNILLNNLKTTNNKRYQPL